MLSLLNFFEILKILKIEILKKLKIEILEKILKILNAGVDISFMPPGGIEMENDINLLTIVGNRIT